MVIPNTWSEPGQLLIPINLVFQISDFRYEIKTSLPVIWLKILTEIRVGPYATNTNTTNWLWSWLMSSVRGFTDPPWEVRQYRLIWLKSKIRVLELGFASNWQCDLKKLKNIIHSSWSIDHHFLTLHWLGNRTFLQIFLMWSQINVLSSIRLTGGRQIDFKVSSLWMPRKYF